MTTLHTAAVDGLSAFYREECLPEIAAGTVGSYHRRVQGATQKQRAQAIPAMKGGS